MDITRNATNKTRKLAREQQIPYWLEMHAFLVLYNVWAGAPCGLVRANMALKKPAREKAKQRRDEFRKAV
jgi:hypothetical protein